MPIVILVLLFTNVLVINAATDITAILADGNESQFLLSDVKRIEVTADEYNGTMTVETKDGSLYGEYIKILFHEEVLSVGELKDIKVKIFPNPVSETLYVQSTEDDIRLVVYDLEGQCQLNAIGNELNVSSLQKGTYILGVNQQYVKFIKK